METFIFFYLLGASGVCLLTSIKLILSFLINRATDMHIYNENVEKIGIYISPFDGQLTTNKISRLAVVILVCSEILLSWVNVFFVSWQIIKMISKALKIFFHKRPNSIEEITFPLKTNSGIASEVVWARLFAVSIIASGAQPTADEIVFDLRNTKNRVLEFDCVTALKNLQGLGVIKEDAIFELIFNDIQKAG